MFGKPASNMTNGAAPARQLASDVAKIQGGGLTQIIVTSLAPFTYYLFLNDRNVPQTDVESLSVNIAVQDGVAPTVQAMLNRYVTTITGDRGQQRTALFPGTIELIGLGRRISLTGMNADSVEGLWISLGLRADGSGAEVTGASGLTIVLTEGLLHAKLTWSDGESEDLLPQ